MSLTIASSSASPTLSNSGSTSFPSSLSTAALATSKQELDVIIECAEKNFWMQPLSVGQRMTLKNNLENYFAQQQQQSSANDQQQDDTTTNTNNSNSTIAALTISSLSKMSSLERKLIFSALGFNTLQITLLQRATQECIELLGFPKAAPSNKLRFVNVTNPALPLQTNTTSTNKNSYQSSNAVSSSLSWNANEYTAALSQGHIVVATHPSLDWQMRELYRDIYKSNTQEFQKIRQQHTREVEDGRNRRIIESAKNQNMKNIFASGIRNQGATCYLNSLLQVLYHVPKLRQVVFSLVSSSSSSSSAISNNDQQDDHDSQVISSALQISKALQKLFVSMEMYRDRLLLESSSNNNSSHHDSNNNNTDRVPNTKELTHSFGWTANEAFVQHDIHECATLMLERLELAMNGDYSSNNNKENNGEKNKPTTKINEDTNEISKLFKIQLKTYFRTTDIDYESSHINSALYLSLPVRNCPTIYDSLDTYFEEQLLDGSSKLCVERNGKKSYHPAKHGTLMEKAPPVLLMFLMRSDFDPQTGEPTKVVSRNEYYERLDMSKYMMKKGNNSDDNDDNNNNKYSLQAVVVHHGSDAGFGHYYAFTQMHVDKEVCEGRDDLRKNLHHHQNGNNNNEASKPEERPRVWVKLNDEIVSLASDYEVYGSNFGGTRRNYWGGLETVTTSAAMLVYVRDSNTEDALFDPYCSSSCQASSSSPSSPQPSSFFPERLRQQYETEELAQEEQKIREKEQRSQIALYGVNLNRDLFSIGNEEEVDKWIFGCPYDIFINKNKKNKKGGANNNNVNLIVPASIGSFNKQRVIDDEIHQKTAKELHYRQEDGSPSSSSSSSPLEHFLISYSPDAYSSVSTYYQGPTKVLYHDSSSSSSSNTNIFSEGIAGVASGLMFLISQPATTMTKQRNKDEDTNNSITSTLVTTFHRFYDPFTETVIPLFGMVSELEDYESATPKDLLDQVLEFVRFNKQQKSSSSTLAQVWNYIEFCLQDSLERRNRFAKENTNNKSNNQEESNNDNDDQNSNNNNKKDPIYMYREEQPGSVYTFPHDATKIISGTCYIWQPHPDLEITKDKIITKEQLSVSSTTATATGATPQTSVPASPVMMITGAESNSAAMFPSSSSDANENDQDGKTTNNSNVNDEAPCHHQRQQQDQKFIISKLVRFSTVDRFFAYQRNKCTIKLAFADPRRGFPIVATVEAAGNATFDEFIEIAMKAVISAQKAKPSLGLYEEPETFEVKKKDGKTTTTRRDFSYHFRIGKNSSADGPECPPNAAIFWYKQSCWTALNFTLRSNQKQGTLFFDFVRVYDQTSHQHSEHPIFKIYDEEDDIEEEVEYSSNNISSTTTTTNEVVSHIHHLESKAILTFEFFDATSIRPFSRHSLHIKKSFGSFQTKHLLKWIRRTILRDYVQDGTISIEEEEKKDENDNDEQQKQQQHRDPNNNSNNLSLLLSPTKMILSPKKRELALTRNLEKLMELEGQQQLQLQQAASFQPASSSSSSLLVEQQLVDVWNGRVYSIFKSAEEPEKSSPASLLSKEKNPPVPAPTFYKDSLIKSLEANSDYRFEITNTITPTTTSASSDTENNNNNNTSEITVVHFSMMRQTTTGNNNQATTSFVPTLHGDPFFHQLEPGETLGRFRIRIAERLSLSIERVERWFVRLVGSGGFSPVQLSEEGDDGKAPIAKLIQQARDKAVQHGNSSVNVKKNNFQIWVGLEHAPLPGTRAQAGRRGAEERAFSIA